MISFYFVNGSDEHVLSIFEQSIPAILAAIEKSLMRAMADLQAYIQRNKLQGQVLNSHKNGAGLAGSLNIRMDVDGGVSIAGYVGTALIYARIHEYGFQGPETVQEYTQIRTTAFGRTVAPYTVFVRSHERMMDMPERSYMRSSLDEKREAIVTRIREAIIEALETA